MAEKIDNFDGEYRFLSNFYILPRSIEVAGIPFATTEHLYQALKADNLQDFTEVSKTDGPYKTKKLGQKVSMRSDWNNVKIAVMEFCLRLKFQIPEMKDKLLATGDAELIEGNTWKDTWWGVDKNTGKGKNHLGKLLMKVRKELQEKS